MWGSAPPEGLETAGVQTHRVRPTPEESEFIAEIDREAVLSARRRTLRTLRASAWVQMAGSALFVVIAALTAMHVPSGAAWKVTWLVLLPGPILWIRSWRQYAAVRHLEGTWNTMGVPAVAMRMSAHGLRCSIDAAPDHLFLPWSAITGFRLRTWRGQQILVLELAPGLKAGTPGVSGLDHPDVQRVLHHKVFGVQGLRFAVSTLRQPLEEIDRALAHFTQGRVHIHT
jgi:hypothetical protein